MNNFRNTPRRIRTKHELSIIILENSDSPKSSDIVGDECKKNKLSDTKSSKADYKCQICLKVYTSLRLLNFHRKKHKFEKQDPSYTFDNLKQTYRCNTCFNKFQHKHEIKEHIKVHSCMCPVCYEYFPTALLLGWHMAEHNPDGYVSCPLCDHKYKTFYGNILQAHIRKTHEKLDAHYCKHCGSSYFKKNQLIEHINVVHLKRDPYKCVVCDKQFIMSASLYKHQVEKHKVLIDGDLPTNSCLVCKTTFRKVSALEKHLNEKHRNPKLKKQQTYVCDTCGKGFGYRQSLKVHQRGHEGIKPFKCSFCSKVFKLNSQRLVHEAVHTNIRPYSCDQCGLRFKLMKTLRVHLNTHKVEKSFVCEFCKKGYNRADHYKLHLKNCKRSPIHCKKNI